MGCKKRIHWKKNDYGKPYQTETRYSHRASLQGNFMWSSVIRRVGNRFASRYRIEPKDILFSIFFFFIVSLIGQCKYGSYVVVWSYACLITLHASVNYTRIYWSSYPIVSRVSSRVQSSKPETNMADESYSPNTIAKKYLKQWRLLAF